MRIGIITQPLTSNYGGLIQNWALQQALKKIGHDPITIDVLPRSMTFIDWIIQNLITVKHIFNVKIKRPYYNLYKHRPAIFEAFVKNNIVKTRTIRTYSANLIKEYDIKGLVVGSDQVWRPKYNIGCIEDMFLRFIKNFHCVKSSYAASFGTDDWEFNKFQTAKCTELIKDFKAVSVREESGISLCKRYLGVNAVQVLDPTLLLEKKDYLNLIKHIERICNEKFLAAYVLDMTPDIESKIVAKASVLGLQPIIITADYGAELSVEQWISIFRDAEYIFTDSFHGSVFSLIFEKEFEFLINESRGSTRFSIIKELIENSDIISKRELSYDYLKNTFNCM